MKKKKFSTYEIRDRALGWLLRKVLLRNHPLGKMLPKWAIVLRFIVLPENLRFFFCRFDPASFCIRFPGYYNSSVRVPAGLLDRFSRPSDEWVRVEKLDQ